MRGRCRAIHARRKPSPPDRSRQVAVGADEEVAVAVTVHIPGGGDGGAELRLLLIPLREPRGNVRRTVRTAQVHQSPSRYARTESVACCEVIRDSDDDVRVSISVHIARRADRCPQVRGRGVPQGRPICIPRLTVVFESEFRRSEPDESRPTGAVRIVIGCSHDHVAESVAIHVAGGAHGRAEQCVPVLAGSAPIPGVVEAIR